MEARNTYKEIPLADILEPEHPVRLTPKETEIEQLAKSIQKIGLIQPIRVQPENGKYRIICGHRRYLACIRCKHDPIESVIENNTNPDILGQMLAENISRRDMTPLEQACYLDQIRKHSDLSARSLAELIGRSIMYVQHKLRILTYPTDIQQAIHEGKLKESVALHLSKVDDPDIRLTYLRDAIRTGITSKTAKLWLDIYREQKQLREKGKIDPRRLDGRPVVKVECDLCRDHVETQNVRSIILCRRCQRLIQLFWEEYNHDTGEVANHNVSNLNVSLLDPHRKKIDENRDEVRDYSDNY